MAVCLLLCSCALNPVSSSDLNAEKASDLNVQLGEVYLDQGNLPLAKQKFVHALSLSPNSAEAHAGMAAYWSRVGVRLAAESEYQQALRLSPRDPNILGAYAGFECQDSSRYQQALSDFDRALSNLQNLNHSALARSAGHCALSAHQRDLAKSYFEQARRETAS